MSNTERCNWITGYRSSVFVYEKHCSNVQYSRAFDAFYIFTYERVLLGRNFIKCVIFNYHLQFN